MPYRYRVQVNDPSVPSLTEGALEEFHGPILIKVNDEEALREVYGELQIATVREDNWRGYIPGNSPPSPADTAIESYVNEGGLLTREQMREFMRRVGELRSYSENIPVESQDPFGADREGLSWREDIQSAEDLMRVSQEAQDTFLADSRERGTVEAIGESIGSVWTSNGWVSLSDLPPLESATPVTGSRIVIGDADTEVSIAGRDLKKLYESIDQLCKALGISKEEGPNLKAITKAIKKIKVSKVRSIKITGRKKDDTL